MKTIPTKVLLADNIDLTNDPTASNLISKQQAILAANNYAGVHDPTLVADEAVQGQQHNVYGLPTIGQSVWIVNVSPASITIPNPNPTGEYIFVIIDAHTGLPITQATLIAHPPASMVGVP